MKKIIAMLILSVTLISCGASTEANARDEGHTRFKLIQSTSCCNVVVDTETGVEYAVSTGTYNWGNMTVLVDETGKPLIWKGE